MESTFEVTEADNGYMVKMTRYSEDGTFYTGRLVVEKKLSAVAKHLKEFFPSRKATIEGCVVVDEAPKQSQLRF